MMLVSIGLISIAFAIASTNSGSIIRVALAGLVTIVTLIIEFRFFLKGAERSKLSKGLRDAGDTTTGYMRRLLGRTAG
jgi:hypothetical protein